MIFVFKTSVNKKRDVKLLSPFLDAQFEAHNWNFDLEDCDKILRIVSKTEISLLVIALLEKKGFQCEELAD